ncbi:hypothetical protein CCY99_06165 [Helicobacter sp. 16-1353]|uniref:hypothetical protein n=1 Tax=Helicobacter sp. 16-1353 TaxID=2004996 RepID=UPI000DCD6D65|nr:hypothetical protein [Helicobacter sp. 16-1353]RAX53175.1 hypothetical protein CCY99_06165 [Helicobacter sp. 16-1353]
MSWIDELKIAILNKDDEKVLNLIEDLPKFDNIDDLICARELVGEFIKKLQKDRDSLSKSMIKLKQMRFFLED